jgi:hypothetical protein
LGLQPSSSTINLILKLFVPDEFTISVANLMPFTVHDPKLAAGPVRGAITPIFISEVELVLLSVPTYQIKTRTMAIIAITKRNLFKFVFINWQY